MSGLESWQPQPRTKMPTFTAQRCELVCADPRWWDCPQLNTAEHLRASLGDAITLPAHLADALRTDWATEHEPALLRWFSLLTHQSYEHVHRDNTYNSENDLSENSVFSVFAPSD